MTGMHVLDVGSATGFFSFEFERRGAQVVSVEVPSLDDIDRFPYQDVTQTVPKLAAMTAGESAYTSENFDSVFRQASETDFYHYVLDGPFRFCHKALGSQVERHYSTIYAVPETQLGNREVDLVFLGDLLLHTMHPLSALAAVAPLCTGTLVISQDMPAGLGSQSAIRYVGATRGDDDATWWYANRAYFEQLLKLGFRRLAVVGRHTSVSRPGGKYCYRPAMHATR